MKNLQKIFFFLNNNAFIAFEERILNLFKTFPELPPAVSDFLVSFGPYLVLIGGVFSVLSISTLLPIGVFILYAVTSFLYISVLGSVVSGIMLITAFEDLKERKLFGWRLVFWAVNIGIITSVLSLNILGAVIGALISWYILSQIRERYS